MRNRCRSLLLLSARLVVGYPAAWLLAMSSSPLFADVLATARCHQSLFDWLVREPVRRWAAYFAPRNGAELTLYGLAVTASAFTLTLWALPA
jgi:hypothetical protein